MGEHHELNGGSRRLRILLFGATGLHLGGAGGQWSDGKGAPPISDNPGPVTELELSSAQVNPSLLSFLNGDSPPPFLLGLNLE